MAAFTAVAAGVGLAVTAATTAASFAQAAEQNAKKRKAEESAANAMMEARKKLEVNYYEQLGIQKEPYELARRELLSQGALATQQLAEGDPRALAAGVGRVQLAQQLGQEKVATAMQQEKAALDKLVAGEESRLRDLGTQLDLQEAVGAQQAMADAAVAEQMALQQGISGVTSLAGQAASLAPLYEKSSSKKAIESADKTFKQSGGGSTLQSFEMLGMENMPKMNKTQLEILKGYKTEDFRNLPIDAKNAFLLEYDPQTIKNVTNVFGAGNKTPFGYTSNPFIIF